MITPNVDCFFYVEVEKDLAELIAKTLSSKIMADIDKAVLLSKDYPEDMKATLDFDKIMDLLKVFSKLKTEKQDSQNPLYYPNSMDEIQNGLDDDLSGENFYFSFMEGNPFAIKKTKLNCNGVVIADGTLCFKPYDLPSYPEIVKHNKVLTC